MDLKKVKNISLKETLFFWPVRVVVGIVIGLFYGLYCVAIRTFFFQCFKLALQ